MFHFNGWSILILCGCAAMTLAGCNSGPTKHNVTGVVDIDGQPIVDGSLTFEPEDKKLPPEGAKIKDGKYSVAIAAGSYKVKVIATKKVPLEPGEAAGTPGEKDKLVSIVPAHYDDKNPIVREIKGPGEVDIKLSAKKG